MSRQSSPLQEDSAQSLSLPKGSVIEELRVRSPQKKEDREHRLRMESRSFWIKEAPVYLIAILLLLGTALYCFWTLFHPSLPSEDRQWAKSILGSLMGGVVGYLFGKATK